MSRHTSANLILLLLLFIVPYSSPFATHVLRSGRATLHPLLPTALSMSGVEASSSSSSPPLSFTGALRKESMRLHTPKNMKDAKESREAAKGKDAAAPSSRKMPKITGPNLEAWLQASLVIHKYMDSRVASAATPLTSSSALDMSGKIASDLEGLGSGAASGAAPGLAESYLSYLEGLPEHRFLNHYYNLKNAHFAGGLMFHR